MKLKVFERIKKIRNKYFLEKNSGEDFHYFNKLVILIILITISLACLSLNKSQSYNSYERIQFESSGAILYANLYYPSRNFDFQEKRPLIIYCHGIGSKRDFDLRIPIEFAKRGFYVVALDYQGHGESEGSITNIDQATNIPALAQDCSKLLDKLESLPFYSNVNPSQIGLIGHSLGGMVVLMNQALDPRFKVTVAWAPLVSFNPQQLGIVQTNEYNKYVPVNLLNRANTQNLLIIMHVEDELLDFTQNALKAQELTGCTVIPITEPLFGGGHALFSDQVIINSIKWFENHFFRSEIINGPIIINFYLNYILIFVNLILLIGVVLIFISYTSRFFSNNNELDKQNSFNNKVIISKSKRNKQIIKIISCHFLFVLNWMITERLFGFMGIIYASLNFLIVFTIIKLIIHFKTSKNKRVKLNFKEIIKSQFQLKYLVFTFICTWYFILIYLIFSFSYPFAFVWPSNLLSMILTFTIFPIYLSMEIFYRKVIYPQLYFLKSEESKTKVIIIIAIYIQLSLIVFTSTWMFFPSVLFTYFIFLIVVIQNTLIFKNTKRLSSGILYSFDLIQLFFSAVISNALGIGAVLHLFVRL